LPPNATTIFSAAIYLIPPFSNLTSRLNISPYQLNILLSIILLHLLCIYEPLNNLVQLDLQTKNMILLVKRIH